MHVIEHPDLHAATLQCETHGVAGGEVVRQVYVLLEVSILLPGNICLGWLKVMLLAMCLRDSEPSFHYWRWLH